MKTVLNNPYRIVGILSNTSERDILKQKSKIKRLSEVGQTLTSEYDFSFLPPLQRSVETIDKAFSDIEQNQNKVLNSLFWFINLNSFDNQAIQHLINGNMDTAYKIWERTTNERSVGAINFSAFNNLGTLCFLDNSKDRIKQGITVKIKLLESDYFKDFVRTVADETYSIDSRKQIEMFVYELIVQLQNDYSNAEIVEFFSYCTETTKRDVTKKISEKDIRKIELLIEQTEKKRNENKALAFSYGMELYQNIENVLLFLKSILGENDLQYKRLADNVANELMLCSIQYFNKNQELDLSTDYLNDAMTLAKLAEKVAISTSTLNYIRKNINILKEMEDIQLNKAIEALKSKKSIPPSPPLKENKTGDIVFVLCIIIFFLIVIGLIWGVEIVFSLIAFVLLLSVPYGIVWLWNEIKY